MIQLKVRTEFSFGETFAPLHRVVERLQEVGATAAGIVDLKGSTWGHVRWQKALVEAGISPLFGLEVGVAIDGPAAPSAWILAVEPQALYRLGSLAHKNMVAGRPTLTRDQFLGAKGLIRFTGQAFCSDPEAVEAGCLIDLNPGSLLATERAVALHRRAGGKLVLTGDNAFCRPADKKVYELIGRNAKPTPQHILSEDQLCSEFARWLTPEQLAVALQNAAEISEQLKGVKLERAPLIKLGGDLDALCREGIARRVNAGHIAAWTEEYEARLQRELVLMKEKEFDSYFLMVADLVNWAKQRMLVGPARGSSAGSLACYLMGITEVDPLPYGLMFERFVDVTRADLPDIDIDFPDTTRDDVYAYLREKYGDEHVARIGTISEYKPKSALAEVAKRLRIPPWETQAVKDAMFTRSSGDSRVNNCLGDTLKETEPGKSLLARFPAIALAGDVEGHASHSGLHAAGVIVCSRPVTDFCLVADGVAQLDKIDAEALNLLKIDALGLRTLSVISGAGILSQEEIYALKFEDEAVFKLLNDGRFSGIFQWEGQALQSLTSQIHLSGFDDMVHITALARPGPLGGGAAGHFSARHAGTEAVNVAHPSMLPYLEETYGLVLYQEQVMRIVRDIGQFSWDETSTIRKAMSGRKGKEFFDKMGDKFVVGAATVGLKETAARDIWDQINSMGAWAFNKSHSVSYAMVSYWTAWMKVHHPLEYAASSLRNSKDEESAFNMLREMKAEGIDYIPFDPDLSELNWSVKDGKLVGGFLGLKGIGPSKGAAMIEARAAGGLTDAQRAALAKCELLFADLYPAHTMWAPYFNEPEKMGLKRGSKITQIAEMPDEGEVLLIGKLMQKDSRDYNEAVRLAKRNGKLKTGPTLFLDMRISDDSSLSPLLVRVDRFEYEPTGRLILERGKEGKDWFLIRGQKLRNFPMVQAEKVRCLNDPELLKEK